MKKFLRIGIVSAAAVAVMGGSDAPLAAVSGGTIQGTLVPGGGAAFKGVPFAEPPVGPLRWREPSPVKAWTGVREATAYGSPCAQMGRGGPSGNEDCLYLNVWTPEWPAKGPHPVMLWLYGGGNVTGSAANPGFDGASLARRGVVVVTTNYRIGMMGFLAHPELSAESAHHASGNYGLLDEIAALKWVRANAAKFGGDPSKVTLFGQSSGAYDLQVLLASPLAKGLFRNVISESGQMTSYYGTIVKGRAEQIGEQLGQTLKAPPGKDALAYLRGLPAAKVVEASATAYSTGLETDTGLLTSVDGWVLPRHPVAVYAAGEEMKVPMIVGNNSREITQELSGAQLRAAIEKKYGPSLAAKAVGLYGADDPLYGAPGAQWMTDTVQRCGAIATARLHSAAHNRTYEYQFDRVTPGREAAGSTHGSEVSFVFGTLDRPGNAIAWTDADRAASDQMQRYWINFAKNNDPNEPGLPAWPVYEPGSARFLEFTSDGPVAGEKLRAPQCDVFNEWVHEHFQAPTRSDKSR